MAVGRPQLYSTGRAFHCIICTLPGRAGGCLTPKLNNTYGVDETNAANLNALKDAVAEAGTLIGDSASTLKEEEVEPLLEPLQTLSDTMDPYYSLFQ